MPVELTIIVKDDERTLKHKTLEYETISLEPSNSFVDNKVQEAITAFQGKPEEVIVKTSMVWCGK